MHRRELLAGIGIVVSGLAGCAARPDRTPVSPASDSRQVSSVAGTELPIPRRQLKRSATRDAIPAIVDPTFGDDWSGLELWTPVQHIGGFDRVVPGSFERIRPTLSSEDPVIGVERAGEARAYPLRILNWHEAVNDEFDGPVLVTYCPLCRSGVTAVRRVAGTETVFGVSGQLWRSNLVLYDELTDSRWAQVAATAIRGPRTGERLELIPSTITTWGAWRGDHPDTRVLLPPPRSNTVRGRLARRDYTTDPYAGYDNKVELLPGSNPQDALHPKALVIGVAAESQVKAYPMTAVSSAGVVNDTVGTRPVVVTVAPGDTLVAYDRTIDGTVHQFESAGKEYLSGGGVRWERSTGRAVDNPHMGRRLTPANDLPPMFWFAWRDFHPDTTVYDKVW